MASESIKIGTRGSRLALRQSEDIAEQLRRHHPDLTVELVIIQSTGDQVLDTPLWQMGGKGVFTKEIESALLDKRVDLAVHSLKDLPTQDAEDLVVAAIPPRVSPFDILLANKEIDLTTLGAGGLVGTSSLRRRAQLMYRYPTLKIENLRGNVPTRIGKMTEGKYACIVLAEAGLNRLGLSSPWSRRVTEEEMLPAPGQGALGLQCRLNDRRVMDLISVLHDETSSACVRAERALLHHLGGGCQAPLGAFAVAKNGSLTLKGRVVSPDCSEALEVEEVGDLSDPEALGQRASKSLLAKGAIRWMAEWKQSADADAADRVIASVSKTLEEKPLRGVRVIVTREEDADGDLSRALREAGAVPICIPLVRTVFPENNQDLKAAVSKLEDYQWIMVTSARALEGLRAAGLTADQVSRSAIKWACVGAGTAAKLTALFGAESDLVSSDGTGSTLAEELARKVNSFSEIHVLFPRSNLSAGTSLRPLRDIKVTVDEIFAYETHLHSAQYETFRGLIEQNACDAVACCSPSAVDSMRAALGGRVETLKGLAVGSMGPSTSKALQAAKIAVSYEANEKTFSGLVKALEEFWAKKQ